VVTVEPVRNTLLGNVAPEVRKCPVCVVLHTRCENDYLVILRHLEQKFLGVWSHKNPF
jgi:hypothetical protein